MKKLTKAIIATTAILGVAALPVQGGPHHHHGYYHGSNGVRLAADIVDLVRAVVAPPVVIHETTAPAVVQPTYVQPTVVQPVVQQPTVVQPVVQQPTVIQPGVQVVPAAPVIIQPAPVVEVTPTYSYRYYEGALLPYWRDWYYRDNSWVWGGRGPRPAPPAWRPHHNPRPHGGMHAPPPPPHGGMHAPPPPPHGGPGHHGPGRR